MPRDDDKDKDSEADCDTSGATEDHSVTEIGARGGGSSKSDDDTIPLVTHTIIFKHIGVI